MNRRFIAIAAASALAVLGAPAQAYQISHVDNGDVLTIYVPPTQTAAAGRDSRSAPVAQPTAAAVQAADAAQGTVRTRAVVRAEGRAAMLERFRHPARQSENFFGTEPQPGTQTAADEQPETTAGVQR